MRTLLVGYDLDRPGQNYEELWKYLRTFGTRWHHLDSTWIVRTDLTPKQLADALLAHGLDRNDEVLVVDLTGQQAAWAGFDTTGSGWLKSHLG